MQQGHYLKLAASQKIDLVWKSHMYDLKQGTLKFLINSNLDTNSYIFMSVELSLRKVIADTKKQN